MQLSTALAELAAGGGAAAAVGLAAAMGHRSAGASSDGRPLRPQCRSAGPVLTVARPGRPPRSSSPAAAGGSRNGGGRGGCGGSEPSCAPEGVGYEADVDVAGCWPAEPSPAGKLLLQPFSPQCSCWRSQESHIGSTAILHSSIDATYVLYSSCRHRWRTAHSWWTCGPAPPP